MAVVARLHPRHWDGCRLLQFLTGLALIALAFAAAAVAAPVAEPAEPPVMIITTVDTPAVPGLVADDEAPGGRIDVEVPAAGGPAVDGPADDGSAADPAGPALDPAGAVQQGDPLAARPLGAASGARIRVESVASARGVDQRADGERAPPRI